MAYCSQADLEIEIGTATLRQLTDDSNTGSIVAEKVTWAIAEADALINGYCQARYSTPFSTVPALIKKLSVTIAKYELYLRRVVPEAVRLDYDWAMRTLEKVNSGAVKLETDSVAAPENDGQTARSNVPDDTTYPRVFKSYNGALADFMNP